MRENLASFPGPLSKLLMLHAKSAFLHATLKVGREGLRTRLREFKYYKSGRDIVDRCYDR